MQIEKADSQLGIQFEWFIEKYNLRGISFSSLRIDTILDDITICIIACLRDRKVEHVRIRIGLEIRSYLVLQVIAFLLSKFCTLYIPPPELD
jgi:hypothetical protein